MSIDRYRPAGFDPDMETDPEGEYVLYDDLRNPERIERLARWFAVQWPGTPVAFARQRAEDAIAAWLGKEQQ